MNLDEIQHIFFQECEEGLATLESCFALFRAGSHDAETVNTVFRAVHSIKGGAGAFGFERLQDYTHRYETLLDLIRNGTLSLSPDLVVTVIAAYDVLTDHVAAARDGNPPQADAAMLDRLTAAATPTRSEAPASDHDAKGTPLAEAPATGDGFDDLFAMVEEQESTPVPVPVAVPWRVTVRPDADALDHGGEPLLLIRELVTLGADVVDVDLSGLPPLAAMDPERSWLGWVLRVPGEVDEATIHSMFDFLQGHLEIAPLGEVPTVGTAPQPAATAPDVPIMMEPPSDPAVPPAPSAAASPSPAPADAAPRAAAAAQPTIRVDLDKLDRLVNLVGELVITQAMLAQRLSESGLGSTPELTDLDHLTRELQEATMAIRAQPMKTVFSRVPRIIRELEVETGKRVRLDVDGEMTEVDKTVVERIGEPLTHLIRNAVDHGLESSADRVASGKPEEGVVRLSAAHQSGRIVITVADDGRGIDRPRVRAKAVERGIIAADAVLSDEEIDNLIFAPGFSTAATVSNISGRGVGMDVVRKNIQALGGRIGIASEIGRGSSFSMSLPLTLAVLDGMIVTAGDQTFVIPLSHVVESLRPGQGQVKHMGGRAAMFDVRGAYVPLHRVADQLALSGGVEDPTQAVLIVVESDRGQAVLMVDAILDQRQVVVKSLEANYHAIHGLAGATILGDGRVALILDVDALISRWRHEDRSGSRELAA